MAELRVTEKELIEISSKYNEIQCDQRLGNNRALPELKASLPSANEGSAENDNDDNDKTSQQEGEGGVIAADEKCETRNNSLSHTDILNIVDYIKEKLEKIRPSMDRSRKRLAKKDPVTEKPRYGEKTQVRVSSLLAIFEELDEIMKLMHDENDFDSNSDSPRKILEHLREQAKREKSETEEQARLASLEEEQRLARIANEERERLELRQRQEEEKKQAQLRQEEELRRQQEEARQEEERIRREAQQRDREWMRTIKKGTDGVKEQLRILTENTEDDKQAQKVAVEALRVIFNQICAHPEEPNFRRIRRNHPKFNEDIGRHAGGKELLIAAGFELGEIDGVPSFISKEPDLESDMDRWSAWFDLLKGTLVIIDNQLKQM